MLDIATTLSLTGQVKQGHTNVCHRLGLYLANVARGPLVILHRALGRVAQNDVRKLVESGLVWQRRHGIDCNLPLAGKALTIPVGMLERHLADVERGQRQRRIPLGGLGLMHVVLTLSLRQCKPAWLQGEPRKRSASGLAVLVLFLDRHGHDKLDGLLAALHGPAKLLPALKRGDGPDGNLARI